LSKCLKCGYELPPIGECVACALTVKQSPPARPQMLDKDLRIDRRAPERSPSGSQPSVPGFSDLPRGPIPKAPASRFTPLDEEPETLKDAPLPAPVAPPPPAAASVRPTPAPIPVVTFTPAARPAPAAGEEPTPRPASSGLPVMGPPPAQASVPRAARVPAAAQATPCLQEIHARPASLWRRLLSFGIDTAALVGVAALYITVASSITGVKSPSSQGLTELDTLAAWLHALQSVLVPGFFLLLVLALVYCAVAAFLWNGRTLGRLLLGLRLVDTHGLAPAPGRALVRAMLSAVSFGLFLGGFWMALFDKRGQTLHDKLTSTFVVQPS
jgi:resuscitation-promoting factor RpfA